MSANFTGTVSPTERWSELAVVVSMSRSPADTAREVPAVMFKMTVRDRFSVERARRVSSDLRISNCPP